MPALGLHPLGQVPPLFTTGPWRNLLTDSTQKPGGGVSEHLPDRRPGPSTTPRRTGAICRTPATRRTHPAGGSRRYGPQPGAARRLRSRVSCGLSPCCPQDVGRVRVRAVVRPVQRRFACALVFAEVGIGTMRRQLPDRLGVPPTGGCAQRCALRTGAAALGVGTNPGFHEQARDLRLALHCGQVQRGGSVAVLSLWARSPAQQGPSCAWRHLPGLPRRDGGRASSVGAAS